MNAATLTLAAGSTFMFDDNSTATVFRLILNTSSKLMCNGRPGSRVTVQSKVGGTNGRITYGGGYGGQVDCTYTDFTRIGDATHNAFEFYPNGDDIFRLQTSVVLTASGPINMAYFAYGSTTVVLNGVSTSVGRTAYDLQWYFGLSTGRWQIANSVFDKAGTIGTQTRLTITNNLFLEPPMFSGNTWSSFDNNLVHGGSNTNFLGDLTNNYFLLTNSDNPHGPTLSSNVSLQVTGNVFEYTGSAGNGDCLLTNTSPAEPAIFAIRHNILLPSDGDPTNAACGDIISVVGGGANLTLVVEHNTFNVGPPESGVSIGETYHGHADMLASVQNNLAFSNSGLGSIINDNRGGAVVPNDITTADYNGRNTMSTSSNVPVGTIRNTAGVHDVIANPNFVDSTRNLATWSAALGGAGTVPDALVELAKANDASGYNNAYTVAALLVYIKAGFVPMNEAFHAANDYILPSKGWMGAMPGGEAEGVPTVNGSSTPITVATGATVTVGVQNGPGNPLDWVGLYQTSAPESGYLSYRYLNGSMSASLPFTLQGTLGNYEFHFFSNNSFTRIATSPAVTVQ